MSQSRECSSSQVHSFNWWVVSCDDPVPTQWSKMFSSEQSHMGRSAETMLGWLRWPRASQSRGFQTKVLSLGLSSVGMLVGVERGVGKVPFSGYSYFVGWCQQIIGWRTLFGTCADIKKRWLLWFSSSQSHLKPLYFQIDLSSWFVHLFGFTQLLHSSSRGQGSITGVIKSKRESGAWSGGCYFSWLKPKTFRKIFSSQFS